MDENRFWEALATFVATHAFIVDRPRGTAHPRFPDAIYPLDYGYLEGTTSGDGQGVDVWRGSLAEPRLVGVLCAVDAVKCDVEIKLLLGCTRVEGEAIQRFSSTGSQAALLLWRGDEEASTH